MLAMCICAEQRKAAIVCMNVGGLCMTVNGLVICY